MTLRVNKQKTLVFGEDQAVRDFKIIQKLNFIIFILAHSSAYIISTDHLLQNS